MKEDIYGVLKNALQRGATKEQAIQSLINAGYNATEVKQTANQIIEGALTIIEPQQTVSENQTYQKKVVPQKLPRQIMKQQAKQVQISGKKQKGNGKLIVLILILLILIGGLIATIFFRTQIVDFIQGIF